MADMERATGGSKRKLKENAFTAKAESGTLKVKILRQDQKAVDTLGDIGTIGASSTPTATSKRPRRAPKQQQLPDSPPKPRPNRKHVPIFYEPQFRQPIKRGASHSQSQSSSTDESVGHSTSSTGVPGIHSTSSTDVSGGGSAATSSTSSSFVSQLSDVRLQSASTSGGDIGPPPRANPLFARNDSDGLGTLGDLLKPYFPSPSGLLPRFPLGGAQPTRTTSSAGLLTDQLGLSSALHQLASSSASYRTALDALSTQAPATSVADTPANETTAAASSIATSMPSTTSADTNPHETNGGLKAYRFDPFSALQTAIDHETRKGGMKAIAPAPVTGSASSGTTDGSESNGAADLGPPPSGPPAFTIGNSLMGGGIELQPAATSVNTHNFDWKLHRSASSSVGDGNAASGTNGISHGLRARLERTLASSQHGTDKS